MSGATTGAPEAEGAVRFGSAARAGVWTLGGGVAGNPDATGTAATSAAIARTLSSESPWTTE
jgi:hypothetical protein